MIAPSSDKIDPFNTAATMKKMILIGCLASCLASMAACGGGRADSDSAAPQPDYPAEARKTITADNMDRVLQDLEAEIAADEAAAQ